jgi:hypothetical protein
MVVSFCERTEVTVGVKFICFSSNTGLLAPLSEIQPGTTRKQTRKQKMIKRLGIFFMNFPQFAVFKTTLAGLEDRSTYRPNGVTAPGAS